jgi:hypothetical protein
MPLFTSSLITGLAGALGLAAGSPLAASVPPVSVVSCDYDTIVSDAATYPASAPIEVGNLRITFVNQAPQTATKVRFVVHYAGRAQIIDDSGTFSSGIPISQNFAPAVVSPYYGGGAQCSVEAVTFSDGSTWQPA